MLAPKWFRQGPLRRPTSRTFEQPARSDAPGARRYLAGGEPRLRHSSNLRPAARARRRNGMNNLTAGFCPRCSTRAARRAVPALACRLRLRVAPPRGRSEFPRSSHTHRAGSRPGMAFDWTIPVRAAPGDDHLLASSPPAHRRPWSTLSTAADVTQQVDDRSAQPLGGGARYGHRYFNLNVIGECPTPTSRALRRSPRSRPGSEGRLPCDRSTATNSSSAPTVSFASGRKVGRCRASSRASPSTTLFHRAARSSAARRSSATSPSWPSRSL